MKASRLSIDDQSQKRRKLFSRLSRKPAEIGGNNFFAGTYDRGTGSIGMTVDNNRDWDLFWEQVLGQQPPGPLPKGSIAVMIAEHRAGDPVSFEAEKIVLKDGEISIDWKRLHTATPDKEAGPSQFAVLILPKARNSQTYHDVFVAEEQRQAAEALAKDLKGYTEGSDRPITLLPITKFKRKLEMTRW